MSETVLRDARPDDDDLEGPSRAEEWTRQLGLGVVFVLMGAAAIGIGATLGSVTEHKKPAAVLEAEGAPGENDALAAGIESLSAQVQGLVARPGLAVAQSEVAAADAAVAQMQAALLAAQTENAALKAQIARALKPEAIWAAAELEAAARGSRPFPAELAALQPLLPADPSVMALGAYANTGIPTFDQIRERFRETELAVRRVARGGSNDFGGWVQDTMAQWVTVRRTGGQDDNAASAVLDRAKARLQVMDMAGAVNELKALQAKEAEAAAEWVRLARARMDINERLVALRARVMRDPAIDPAPPQARTPAASPAAPATTPAPASAPSSGPAPAASPTGAQPSVAQPSGAPPPAARREG